LATAQEHINQANSNIAFLQNINHNVNNCFDWQVTVSFYTALHLVNAHISTFELQYRRHTDVKDALNPYNKTSLMKLPENEYTAYMSLQSLSRRARYLVNEKDGNLATNVAFLTYEKHLAKALKHLDVLMQYFTTKYGYHLPTITVKCSELKISGDMKYLEKVK
jgi:hypothetical protein